MYKRQIDIDEENRLFALDHFEQNEMIPFVKKIADAMFSDIPTVLSLIHYCTSNGLWIWSRFTWEGKLHWGASRSFGMKGKVPVEILYSLYTFPIFGKYNGNHWENDFPRLAECLFYNHEANRD